MPALPRTHDDLTEIIALQERVLAVFDQESGTRRIEPNEPGSPTDRRNYFKSGSTTTMPATMSALLSAMGLVERPVHASKP